MADMKDPSQLYDEEFMKKREAMFGSASDDADISSGRDDTQDDDHEQAGLFAKMKKRSKLKNKKSRDDIGDSGYDIFDLEDDEPQTQTVQEAESQSDSGDDSYAADAVSGVSAGMDDINALLASVGIKPLGENESEKTAAPEAVAEPQETVKEYTGSKSKKTGDAPTNADAPNEKTKVMDSISSRIGAETKHAAKKDKSKEKEPAASDGQLMLDGYADSDISPETVSEEEVEAKLKNNRKKLIDNFRVLAKGNGDAPILDSGDAAESSQITDDLETRDGEGIFDAVDRAGRKKGATLRKLGEKAARAASQRIKGTQPQNQAVNAATLGNQLKAQKAKSKKQLIFVGVPAALLLLLSFITAAYNPGGALEFLFGNGARVYTAVNLVLLALCLAFGANVLKQGLESIRCFHPTGSMSVLIVSAFALIHAIISLFTGLSEKTGIILYAAFSAFAMLSEIYCNYIDASLKQRALSFMIRTDKLMGLQPISGNEDASALAHAISTGEDPSVYYSSDISLPLSGESFGSTRHNDEKYYSFASLASMVACFVFGLVSGIAGKSAQIFALCLAGGLCLILPVMRHLTVLKLHEAANLGLISHGSVITNTDACDGVCRADAIAVASEDIFEATVQKFRMVRGGHMTQSDAVVYAAATLKGTKSLISSSFDGFLEETGIRLPDAEDVQCEDRLGYSSWVAGRRVLVGKREMLEAHSIPCPTAQEEAAYSKGRKIMYVVVEGVIAATFIVKYSVRGEVRKSVQAFNKTGLVLMLNSTDPCLDEELVSAKLGADIATIKILSAKNSETVDAYRTNPMTGEDNGLVCSKKKKNILPLVNAAFNLSSALKVAELIAIVGSFFNFAVLVLCAAFKVSVCFTSFTAIIFQVLWAAAAYFVSKAHLKATPPGSRLKP